ncbi:MAG: hypothetical protein KZQ86_03395, partial [Candidatus Thiodiazotropha sp. (ex Lucinoma kastoroae)]|nr:hypothetical protein [Candidatus Thiodiazotropha sp. (ex Lucinoma kastoroae)]
HVANLINEAKIAFSRKRYILPVGSSAYDLYSKITSSEPGNTVAIRGLNEAKFRVYDQIESDIRNKNYQTAYINIDRLSKLNLHDKRFTSLRARLLSLGNNYEKITTDLNNHDDYLLYLLMVANQQEIKGNIWPPVSNNAYNIYKRVLDLESSNSTAREALNALFEKRLSFINNLLDKKHWNEAEREIQAFDKLYSSKNEKAIISSTLEELIRLKDSDAQSSTF